MSIFDLTFLGIGSMLGMGVYIMCGNLATTVGPAMIISFILAGIAATLSALCYAEFAGRAPGTGSAYCYCYITVGEFMAFVLGWNLALEFVIGTACLARGLSGYLDSIADGKMSEYMKEQLPIGVDVLSPYPDFLAFVIMVVFTCLVSVGVKESTIVNNILVVINLITIVVVIVSGFIKADIDNWSIVKTSLPEHFKHVDIGNGGFAPYGFSSILEGAATCFYAYTGFDTVATTGGEANNPQRAIPIALMLSMSIGILAYTCVSATFTLMWPFYDQVSWDFFLCYSIVGSIFGMARVVYSIAHDGLLCTPLGKVNKRTQTPLNATMVAGVLTGVIAIIFDADQLISMTSIGTLMAYSMVGVCVLILRYLITP
ncbi:hypothetical protein AAG570_009537 [Ranatra chinensis]|uniref:Cationic amino acid transporter n=1 Tax=Ranatra chinensis TaxID=642074 RepID=A0ABD0YPZ0_9HEMI